MRWTYILAAVLSLGLASAAMAAGSTSSSTKPAKTSDFEDGVAAVKAENYERAIDLLQKVVAVEPKNADAWNFIGFSHRKLDDLDRALPAYNKALAINPKHRGANEYLGELYLRTGDLAKAEERLEKLDDICFFGCEEYQDLKAAIAAYKSGAVSG
ncbi:MAG: tetratricopeptide repeat protein [Proteobacteria bacterium]|nr:tetratricopeptide repeat protein [Pseudomonadota bacterium]